MLLRDGAAVRQALLQAIIEDDLDTFRDVLIGHLRATSKTRLARKTGLGRQTIYDILQNEAGFDLRVSTLAKLLKSLSSRRSGKVA